jgi:hypothetical protein
VGYVEDLRGKKQGQGRPRWRARYRDPSGRERSRSFLRKVDAERFLVSIEDAKLRGAYVDPAAGRVPFSEWAERWERTTVSLRPNTRKDYRTLLKNQVLPAFGGMTLVAIDALAVREWVAELVANGLSPKRARKAHQVLSQILASAVDGGRFPRNVAEGIKLPKVQRKEMHFLTAAQVQALAEAIEPPCGCWSGSPHTRACDPANTLRSGLAHSTCCGERLGWPKQVRRSPAIWSGVASRPTKRAPSGCRARWRRSWGPTWPIGRMVRGSGVHGAAWWPGALIEVRPRPLQVGHRGCEPGHRRAGPGQPT